jgi:DNA-binding response OmpR family regulator
MTVSNDLILIVDDRSSEIWFIERVVKNSGFKVSIANNGQLGLQKAKEETPDLIILDTTLPDVDSYEVFKLLRQSNATSGIPVVFLSADENTFTKKFKNIVDSVSKAENHDRLIAVMQSLVSHVGKPLEEEAIVNAVSALMARCQGRPEPLKAAGLVLVIDDNRSTVRIAEQSLLQAGFDAITAFNGIDGIKRAKTDHPDLIILDVILPEMNGFEALKRIRQHANTPVIMLTTESNLDSVKKAIALGASGYLSKPFSAHELVARVNSCLRDDASLVGTA